MPTPFNHLVMAESLRRHSELHPSAREILEAERAAFLLGNTAPDYVTRTGEARVRSHFFDVPMLDRRPAPARLLSRHPHLADPEHLSPAHAAFLAGYLAHLWADQAWIAFVFEPRFGPELRRGSFSERLLEHNLLRAAWDLEDQRRLPPDAAEALRRAEPAGWLPFAPDSSLTSWRDDLVRQLALGQPDTMAVFAARHAMPAEEFAARIGPDPLTEAAFAHLPRRRLSAFIRLVEDRTRRLAEAYLVGAWAERGNADLEFLRLPAPRRVPQPA